MKRRRARFVYRFGDGRADGNAKMRRLLGGKGANLAEMARLGVPVPPGVTIPSRYCFRWEAKADRIVANVLRHVDRIRADLGLATLFAVRSGAAVSMPGMMDTVLDVGATDEATFAMLREKLGDRAAFDCRRRFLAMYGNVVLGVSARSFESVLEALREERGVATDAGLTAADLEELCDLYQGAYAGAGREVPTSMEEVIRSCIGAVFRSWGNPRAVEYRRLHGIPEATGTAVTVQAMVFGNAGSRSGTGVLFTRNPATGEPGVRGEFLRDAQGEDVVAGIRTPEPLEDVAADPDFEEPLAEVRRHALALEAHYRDVQDVEFTVERGKAWVLQTRAGKRTAAAAFRIAHDLVAEGTVSRRVAARRITRRDVLWVSVPHAGPGSPEPDAVGIAGSAGLARGYAVTSAEEALKNAPHGPVVLMANETNPEDVAGMAVCAGIVTRTGGFTSHAAVVARGMNVPCVTGVPMKRSADVWIVGGCAVEPGTPVAIDGATGSVWVGARAEAVEVVDAAERPEVRAVFDWILERANVVPRVSRVTGPRCHVVLADAVDARDVEAVRRIVKDVAALEDRSGVVLDFTPPYQLRDDAGNAFFHMLGEAEEPADDAFLDFDVAEVLAEFPDGALAGVVVVAGHAGVDAEMERLGAVRVREAETIADLLAPGKVRLGPGVVDGAFGTREALDRFLAMMVNAGTPVDFLGVSCNPDHAVYEAAKEDGS